MKHIMLDLETWGASPGCALRSIGAVEFDPHSEALISQFYCNVGTDGQGALAREERTVDWWSKQSAQAQAAFYSPGPLFLNDAIGAFGRWFVDKGTGTFLWAHGVAFDPPILEAAYKEVGVKVPWDFRLLRDTRTLFDIAGLNPLALAFTGTPHHALDDAVHQARCVQEAYRLLARERSSRPDYVALVDK